LGKCPLEAFFVIRGWRQFVSAKKSDEDILNQIAMFKGNNMLRKSVFAMMFTSFESLAYADVQPLHDATGGGLLYSIHCIACHSAQVHWREKKFVADQTSLQAEVRRSQGILGLGWSGDDIAESLDT
jgi:hypothetical protein